jgi:hypothetical protein
MSVTQKARSKAPMPMLPDTRPVPVPSSYQAFRLLQAALMLVPLVAGIDKFAGALVDWRMYFAGGMGTALGASPAAVVRLAGAAEIVIALLVMFAPRIGGAVLGGWFALVMLHLLSGAAMPDVALLYGGLALASIALSRLSAEYELRVHQSTPGGG